MSSGRCFVDFWFIFDFFLVPAMPRIHFAVCACHLVPTAHCYSLRKVLMMDIETFLLPLIQSQDPSSRCIYFLEVILVPKSCAMCACASSTKLLLGQGSPLAMLSTLRLLRLSGPYSATCVPQSLNVIMVRLRVSRMAKLMKTFPELMLIVKALLLPAFAVSRVCVSQARAKSGHWIQESEYVSNRKAPNSF